MYAQCCAADTIKFFSVEPRIQFTFYISTVDTSCIRHANWITNFVCAAWHCKLDAEPRNTICIHSANVKSKLYPRHSTEKVNCIRSTTLRIQRPAEISVCKKHLHCAYKFHIYFWHRGYYVNAVQPCGYICIHSLAQCIQQLCMQSATPFSK